MGNTLFISRILGPCMLVIGAGIMFNRQAYQKVMEDYCKNAALVFFGGVAALVIGLVIVLSHNVWEASWRVIVTLYGWGGIVKGIWLTVLPETVPKFMQAYSKNKALLAAHSLLVIVLGACLTALGYFVG